jgi:hypothetical protein
MNRSARLHSNSPCLDQDSLCLYRWLHLKVLLRMASLESGNNSSTRVQTVTSWKRTEKRRAEGFVGPNPVPPPLHRGSHRKYGHKVNEEAKQNRHKSPHNKKTAAGARRRKPLMPLEDRGDRSSNVGGYESGLETFGNTCANYVLATFTNIFRGSQPVGSASV